MVTGLDMKNSQNLELIAQSLRSMAADIKKLREMAEEINEEEAKLIPKQPLPD